MAFTTGELLRATGPNTAESIDILTLATLLLATGEFSGGGTGELDPIAKSANYTLDGTTDNNRSLTNGLASGVIEFTLPATPVNGYIARLMRTVAFAVDIDAGAKDIYWGELTGLSCRLETLATIELQYLEEEDMWIVRSSTGGISGLA